MSKPSRMPYFNQVGGKEQIVLAEGYLPTDKIYKIDRYLRVFGFLSQSIEDYLQGNVRGKLKKPTKRMYGLFIVVLTLIVFSRNILLAFNDNPLIRNILGESIPGRPASQLTMALTFWSLYVAAVARLYYRGEKLRYMSWFEPFAVFKGFIPPSVMGLSPEMTDHWFDTTKKLLAKMTLYTNIRAMICSMIFSWIAYVRWNSQSVSGSFNIFWTVILTVWVYFATALAYITYGYFMSLSYYFRMRFNKINNDIESIIDPNARMKPTERCSVLHHVLIEHNELCMKIKEYNVFWAKYLMYTYFMLVTIICYTTFQAFFTYNLIIVRTVMFALALEASYLITKISAHCAYHRLIRVTFDKYPVELQIQTRMFIQRLSGPTIGFYCLDLFEITYQTYASIIAALGQNFLLIVDFVRSYAELKEERAQTSSELAQLQIPQVLNSTFNLNPITMSTEALTTAITESF